MMNIYKFTADWRKDEQEEVVIRLYWLEWYRHRKAAGAIRSLRSVAEKSESAHYCRRSSDIVTSSWLFVSFWVHVNIVHCIKTYTYRDGIVSRSKQWATLIVAVDSVVTSDRRLIWPANQTRWWSFSSQTFLPTTAPTGAAFRPLLVRKSAFAQCTQQHARHHH